MFIVIEGIDLVGKTSQHRLLVDYLATLGRRVSSYTFPAYGTPTGDLIRDYLRGLVELRGRGVGPSSDELVFQCLQLADKYAAAPEISRDLAEGRTVVACRWWQSAHAYGPVAACGSGWVEMTCASLPRADVNVLLDLDPSKAGRRPGEDLDRYEADLARQSRVRQRYLDLWTDDSGEHGAWAVVDAGGSPGEVHGRVLAVLRGVGVDFGG